MIVLFGSLNMDMVVSVDHLPMPGETRMGRHLTYSPGGKGGNQAVAAARALENHHDTVHFFGCVGQDSFGEKLLETLEEENINIQSIQKHEKSTGCASIWLNQEGENSILVVAGANNDAKQNSIPQAFLTPQTIVLLQMENPLEENWLLVKRAARAGAKIILNLAPARSVPEDIFPLLTGLIVNEGELEYLKSSIVLDAVHDRAWGKSFAQKYGLWIAITRGRDGAILCTPDDVWEAPSLLIRPIDTTAAGDAFVGVFAAFMSQGYSLQDCLHYAVAAGGLTCLKKGAMESIPYHASILATRRDLPLPLKVA